MIKIVKHTSIGATLLMILPLIFWISGWQWQPENSYYWFKVWYWITQTVILPWGALISLLLIGWFIYFLCYRFKSAFKLAFILFISLIIGQGIKSFIKELVHEPRPYMVWLNKYYLLDDQVFDVMSHKSKIAVLTQKLQQQQLIPPWLQHYWSGETRFSLPSGHTIFVTNWALLAIGLLWSKQHKIFIFMLMLWAYTIMVSRMFLGMHWPIDIVTGIVISWLIVILSCWLIRSEIPVLLYITNKKL